jgi:hypothetical protein
VNLAEREFEQIRSGDIADVRLIGSDDWSQGRVRQIIGSAARTDDRLLAAQITRPVANSIVAEVELLPGVSDAERNSFCNIGRMAEVRFQRPGFGLADRFLKALAALTNDDGPQLKLRTAFAK